jgi:hypothetical protein
MFLGGFLFSFLNVKLNITAKAMSFAGEVGEFSFRPNPAKLPYKVINIFYFRPHCL